MITINATGDTTLHTAGKYCPEDILVKVPAGSSSGGSVETCTVNILGYVGSQSIAMSILDDNTVSTYTLTTSYEPYWTYDVDNVLCGSCCIVGNATGLPLSFSTNGAELLFTTSDGSDTTGGIFRITAASGETVNITVMDDM